MTMLKPERATRPVAAAGIVLIAVVLALNANGDAWLFAATTAILTVALLAMRCRRRRESGGAHGGVHPRDGGGVRFPGPVEILLRAPCKTLPARAGRCARAPRNAAPAAIIDDFHLFDRDPCKTRMQAGILNA